jgi:hypothetical protein
VEKLKFKNLIPKPRPKNCFAVNEYLMLDREKNNEGNLDVRLKVSYQKRPNSIGQVLIPIELYNLIEKHPNQKPAIALLLKTVQKGLLKSLGDGNVYLVTCSDGLAIDLDKIKKGVKKKKKSVKKKPARKKKTKSKPTEIPSDRYLKRVIDPKLGNFKYREDFYDYTCESVEWCDQKIRFVLSVEEPEETKQRFEEARKIWKAQKRWQKNCLDYAAKEMLVLANEWLVAQKQKAISAATLKKRIRLTSIEFFEDGDISFWYDTDEIFYEKGICVAANVSGELFEATND